MSCNSKTIKNIDSFLEFKKDTLFSKGDEIIFFQPSDVFYQKKLKHIEGIEEIDSDFKFYSNEVYNDINTNVKLQIKTFTTEKRYLAVINKDNDTTIVDRYNDSLYYGTLLNFKNKKFVIEEGVFTDDDFSINLLNVDNQIDFNDPPIIIKEITLNENAFWTTSLMVTIKPKDSVCLFKDYTLKRIYNIVSKNRNEEMHELVVYVKNDKFKWNREKAYEELESFSVTDKSIKLWDSVFVGMKVDDLITLIELEEYHKDYNAILLYSKVFKSKFYFDLNNNITKIDVKRICK